MPRAIQVSTKNLPKDIKDFILDRQLILKKEIGTHVSIEYVIYKALRQLRVNEQQTKFVQKISS